MPRTVIDLIRHGEPVGGIRFRGQTDDPLSPKGWQQMQDAVGDYRDWDLIVSSPLSRCLEFAEMTAGRLAIPLRIESRFREIGFGTWENRTAEEISHIHPEAVQLFYRDPAQFPPEGGEPLGGFQSRVTAAWDGLVGAHAGKHILLVCHGGTIRIVLSHILHIPMSKIFRLTVPNASLTRIHHYSEDSEPFAELIFHHGRL
ncbi:MAG: histidine phosphatase family protein [Gammaproteobacteria bacterium]